MLTVFVFPSTESNKRLERTRLERASLGSCVGEPLKRNVGRFMLETRIMKSNVQSLLLTPIFLGALSCGQQKQVAHVENNQPQSKTQVPSQKAESANPLSATDLQPKKRCVADEQTAIAIAVAVWVPIYGKAQIESEKPYKATLINGIWFVKGSLPEGYDGGTAVAEISQKDGRILKVIHYQ